MNQSMLSVIKLVSLICALFAGVMMWSGTFVLGQEEKPAESAPPPAEDVTKEASDDGGATMTNASRILTDADLQAGKRPETGDTVLLSDFSRCYPQSVLRTESVKGKWWLRPYRTASGKTGTMLCVEERDMDDPQSCIAPELKYHLNLEGTYDIWVGTYRPIFGGGIDIKLSHDKMYGTIDPWQTGLNQWPPPDEQIGRIVECFWKTDDLTDQDIYLRQPHGAYQGFWWGLCEAHVAYIKLIRRSPEEVARQAAAKAKLREKGVIINRDGFSWIWAWGTDNLDCVLQQVENLQYDNVNALDFCIAAHATTRIINYPTATYTTKYDLAKARRLGSKRALPIYQKFEDNNIDILEILTERCHELGIKIYANFRINSISHGDAWRQHPEWRQDRPNPGPSEKRSESSWDFAKPGPREFYRDFMLYAAENYDIDGITVDFSRGRRRQVTPPAQDKLEYMNIFMRELRQGLNEIAAAKGKPLALNTSFVCHCRADHASPQQQGLDIQTWVDENIVDLIMPHGRDAMDYVEMAKGKETKCYVRTSRGRDFAGQVLQAPGTLSRYPHPGEGKQDRPASPQWFPLDYIEELLKWYDAGADGVYQFNLSDAWVPYRNLAYPKLLRQEVASGQPFGQRKGEKVEWIE